MARVMRHDLLTQTLVRRLSKPNKPTLSKRALEFARFTGMTIELLPNGDLKVIEVDPQGGATKKGIRSGNVISKWTYENQGGNASGSASIH
jgi:hypothetical protein